MKGSVLPFSVFSDLSKYRDPLHLLLDYIAEVSQLTSLCHLPHSTMLTWIMQQAPDCEMVLAHDDDLATIDGLGHDTVSRVLYCSHIFP